MTETLCPDCHAPLQRVRAGDRAVLRCPWTTGTIPADADLWACGKPYKRSASGVL